MSQAAGALQGIAVADQDIQLGGPRDTDHDRDRRRQSQGAGTGDHQHRNTGSQGIGQARLGTEQQPGGAGQQRDQDHHRHEHRRDPVHQPADGGFAHLRLFHHAHDLGQGGLLSQPGDPQQQHPVLIDGATGQRIARDLFERGRFSAQHRLVDAGEPFHHLTIDRNPLTGSHPDQIPQPQQRDRQFQFLCCAHHTGGFRRQVEQAADRLAGGALGAGLQHMPELQEGQDHHRGIEIEAGAGLGDEVGPEHQQHGREPGGPGAQGHQGIHVGGAVPCLLPGAPVIVAAAEADHEQAEQADAEPETPPSRGLQVRQQGPEMGRHQPHAHQAGQPGALPGPSDLAAGLLHLLQVGIDILFDRPGPAVRPGAAPAADPPDAGALVTRQ